MLVSRGSVALLLAGLVLALIHGSSGAFNGTVDQSRFISVIYSDGEFEVMPGQRYFDNVVAWAELKNNQLNTGWMNLELSTRQSFPDYVQALAAGFAEGYLTRNLIYEYYKEFMSLDLCTMNGFCDWMNKHIETNNQWLEGMIADYASDSPYWHMINMFYQQIRGMKDGWLQRTKDQGEDVPADFDVEHGMYLLTYMADVWDYVEIFKMEGNKWEKKKSTRPTCSVMIKHLADQGDLYVGHNAWHEYRAMGYRLLKKYNIPYRKTPNSVERIPGHTLTMSSYAGTIFSLDDFVTTSAGLLSTETTLNIYNTDLYKENDPSKQVFEPARVMTANRLAESGKEWTDLAARFNSGTYNNQWMVVDFKKLSEDGKTYKDGLLWVLEQLPGTVWAADQTRIIRRRGYWGSYNRPFYPDVFELSGGASMSKSYGSWFSYDETARAKIMRRDHVNIVDEASMMQFMRYNNFKEDAAAIIPGCKAPNPAGSIANRLDLALPDSECEFVEFDHMLDINTPYGALDMKFTTRGMMTDQSFIAVAGPTHGGWMPPFDWSNTSLTSLPNYTPITRFDFLPRKETFNLGDINENIKDLIV